MALSNTDKFDGKILQLVNQERAKRSLKPLNLNQKLDTAADGYSNRMANGDFFSHTDPGNGSNVGTRVTKTGYRWTTVGENIAAGQPTAEAVMKGWMNSSGHRANILNPNFTHLGVGYTYKANDTGRVNYRSYWTQVFGAGDSGSRNLTAQSVPTTASVASSEKSQRTKDTLVGGDAFVGGTSERSGQGTIDTLTGSAASDTFILGDRATVYYNDGRDNTLGQSDYALINNFDPATRDVIQLQGNADDYTLGTAPEGLPAGEAIFLKTPGQDELIAVVQNASNLSLNSASFSYV
jgi:serralysin